MILALAGQFKQLSNCIYIYTEVLKLPDTFLEGCYTEQCSWELNSLSMTPKKLLRCHKPRSCGHMLHCVLSKKCLMEKLQVLKKIELESVSFQKPFAYFSSYSNLFSYKTISNISSIPLL